MTGVLAVVKIMVSCAGIRLSNIFALTNLAQLYAIGSRLGYCKALLQNHNKVICIVWFGDDPM
jgi:hypothetical protein